MSRLLVIILCFNFFDTTFISANITGQLVVTTVSEQTVNANTRLDDQDTHNTKDEYRHEHAKVSTDSSLSASNSRIDILDSENEGNEFRVQHRLSHSKPSNNNDLSIKDLTSGVGTTASKLKQSRKQSNANTNLTSTADYQSTSTVTVDDGMSYKRDNVSTNLAAKKRSKSNSASQQELTDPAESYQNDAARLQKFILQKHNIVHRLSPYSVNYPGRGNYSGILLRFTPFRILSVDEVQQSVSVSCFMVVKWYDSSLSWDPSLFGNINKILIKSTKLWTPTIILPTSTGHGLYLGTTDYLQLSLKQTPTISMNIPFQFTVQCDLDLSRYPFDHQTCVIIFSELNEKEMSAMDSKETDFEMAKALHTSGEWEIVEWDHLNRSVEEPSSLRWIIKIRRQSTFYVANLLIPLMQTSLMTLLVFWIPAESGEKMSYLVSMFVSTSVFLFIINDEMPRSIGDLPTINIIVVAVNSEIILASIASLVVLGRYRYSQNISSGKTLLTSAAKCRNGAYKTEENNVKLHGSQNGNRNDVSLIQRVRPASNVKNPYQFPVNIQTNYYTKNKEQAAHNDEPGKTTNIAYKFSFPEEDKQDPKIVGYVGCSHGTLDMIFFLIFLIINIVAATYAYLTWV